MPAILFRHFVSLTCSVNPLESRAWTTQTYLSNQSRYINIKITRLQIQNATVISFELEAEHDPCWLSQPTYSSAVERLARLQASPQTTLEQMIIQNRGFKNRCISGRRPGQADGPPAWKDGCMVSKVCRHRAQEVRTSV
jgi:hypothetical protein